MRLHGGQMEFRAYHPFTRLNVIIIHSNLWLLLIFRCSASTIIAAGAGADAVAVASDINKISKYQRTTWQNWDD